MEKVEQRIRSQNLRNSSISGKYLYWVIIVYGLVSFLRVIGAGFTYIDYLAPGNVYELSSLILAIFFLSSVPFLLSPHYCL
ncbi:MAG: hypothetical protein WA102_11520 [Candidatus Methanoperedens sp.]